MKLLELFAGSRSMGKQAEKLGFEVYSVDKFITENMNKVCGVEELTKEMILDEFGTPTVIHASPVCSAWSKTGWFHYWDTEVYSITKQFLHKKPFAIESVDMVRKTIEIFSWFPDAVYFMENPDAMLQFHPVTSLFKTMNLKARKHLITYCQYGDTVRKPTNIWTNCTAWMPKPMCSNGDKCHMRSPRCTQTGIMTKKDSYERSKIPDELCKEMLEASLLHIKDEQIDYKQNELFAAERTNCTSE